MTSNDVVLVLFLGFVAFVVVAAVHDIIVRRRLARGMNRDLDAVIERARQHLDAICDDRIATGDGFTEDDAQLFAALIEDIIAVHQRQVSA